MRTGMSQQKAAVDSGAWMLYRYDPRLADEGKNPLQIDSKPPTISLDQYTYNENRFKMLSKMNPEVAKNLLTLGQKDVDDRQNFYRQLAEIKPIEAGRPRRNKTAKKALPGGGREGGGHRARGEAILPGPVPSFFAPRALFNHLYATARRKERGHRARENCFSACSVPSRLRLRLRRGKLCKPVSSLSYSVAASTGLISAS